MTDVQALMTKQVPMKNEQTATHPHFGPLVLELWKWELVGH
jgi:hypothetical protein